MNTFSYGAFVTPRGGLGGPPSFLACQSISFLNVRRLSSQSTIDTSVTLALLLTLHVASTT
jgi:hypothetical protein